MKLRFPKLSLSKTYGNKTTPEQDVLLKLVQSQKISKNDEAVLIDAIVFYQKAFAYLKSIDLSKITDENAVQIKEYMRSVFNMQIIIQNKINFYNVFRLSFVKNNFLENGKVRNMDFIIYPPEKIIKKNDVYGRANTPNSTIFYCSFEPGVAVLETKPTIGQRIIIAHWYNENAKDFITYPITNNKTIDNDSLKSATKAFQERMKYNHPLFANILDMYFEFLSSEFVKDIRIQHPKKYEYLYSAYFSDWMLENKFEPVAHPIEPIIHYDSIIYPSIAINYKSENLAILPSSLEKLKPIHLEDSIVVKTMYENPDLSNNKLPIARKVLRVATTFDGKRIIWNDD